MKTRKSFRNEEIDTYPKMMIDFSRPIFMKFISALLYSLSIAFHCYSILGEIQTLSLILDFTNINPDLDIFQSKEFKENF